MVKILGKNQWESINLDDELGSKVLSMIDFEEEIINDYLSRPEEIYGLKTRGWHQFNSLCGGQRKGELILVTADTGMGKTTFVMNWAVDTMESKEPVLYISLENPPKNVVKQIANMHLRYKVQAPASKESLKQLQQTMSDNQHLLYLLQAGHNKSEQTILKAIVYAKKKYGIRTVMLDHLDFIIPNQGARNESEATSIKNMLGRLADATQKLQITTIAIQHPAKFNDKGGYKEKDRGDRHISLDEIKGSSAMKQIPDMVITLRQPSDQINTVEICFQKIRDYNYGMNRGKKTTLGFDPNSQRYSELGD